MVDVFNCLACRKGFATSTSNNVLRKFYGDSCNTSLMKRFYKVFETSKFAPILLKVPQRGPLDVDSLELNAISASS